MSSTNPYAPPSVMPEIVPTAVQRNALQVASQGTRFVNMLLDTFFTYILSMVGGMVYGFLYAVSRSRPSAPITPDEEAMLQLTGMIIGLGLTLLYFIGTEALFQRSFAKFITGTKVVNADGSTPSFGQIIGRTFARLIPFEAFSFLGNSNPVGWHDSLSGTRVVKVR